MKGDTQGGSLPKIHTDVSFGDILDVLDFGLISLCTLLWRAQQQVHAVAPGLAHA